MSAVGLAQQRAAWRRARAEALMTGSVTLIGPGGTPVSDGAGGYTTPPGAQTTVSFRYAGGSANAGGIESGGAFNSAVTAVETVTIIVPAGTAVSPQDTAQIASARYEVRAAPPPGPDAADREVTLVRRR